MPQDGGRKPIYGSWRELKMPVNTSERRHTPSKRCGPLPHPSPTFARRSPLAKTASAKAVPARGNRKPPQDRTVMKSDDRGRPVEKLDSHGNQHNPPPAKNQIPDMRKLKVPAKVDSGIYYIRPQMPGEHGDKPIYGSWPGMRAPINTSEKRHTLSRHCRPLPQPVGKVHYLPNPLAKRWNVPGKVDSGRVFTRSRMHGTGLKSVYGSWPQMLPVDTHQKQHPQGRQCKPKLPTVVKPSPQIGKWQVSPKVDSGMHFIRPRVLQEGGLKPAYGSWPVMTMPFNTRERRHPPNKPARPPPLPPGKPVVHLDFLKHKKVFPRIRNSSQLGNYF